MFVKNLCQDTCLLGLFFLQNFSFLLYIQIRDRECAVVPSEDNDTLFVGNICKTWKSEQVHLSMRSYLI